MNIQMTTEQTELCKLINKLERKTGKTATLSILKAVLTLSLDKDSEKLEQFFKHNYSYCLE